MMNTSRKASSPGLLREEITSFVVVDDATERVRDRQVFVYDDEGNLMEEAGASGAREEETSLTPDPAFAFQIDGIHFSAPNAVRMRRTFDAESRCREIEFLDGDGGVIVRLDWIFDDDHRSTEIRHCAGEAFPYIGGTLLSEVHERRDERGNITERTVRVMGEDVSRQQFFYDDAGLPRMQTEIDARGRRAELRFRHRLDERGEWFEREVVRSIDGESKIVEVARRRLTYRT
jgi:hypothetical protein